MTPMKRVNVLACAERRARCRALPLLVVLVVAGLDGATRVQAEVTTTVRELPSQCVTTGNITTNDLHLVHCNAYYSSTTLDLSSTGLSSIAEAAFDNLEHIAVLHLHFNRLTSSSITPRLLQPMPLLEEIRLDNNLLTSIDAALFYPAYSTAFGAGRLRHLSFADNRITSLPAKVFRGLSKLEYLDLSNNLITSLADGQFDGAADSLETLSLTGNDLNFETLHADTFRRLTKLNNFWHERVTGWPYRSIHNQFERRG